MASTHVVAKAIITDASGKFLLLTRSETHPALAGKYDLPGGMVESGEEPGAGVAREIFEETGIKIESAKMLYAVTMLVGNESYPTLLYRVQIDTVSPDITLSWEHSAYEWAELAVMKDVEPQLAPTYRTALEYIETHSILEDL